MDSSLSDGGRPKKAVGQRVCLKCNEGFESRNVRYIRICDPCKAGNRKIADVVAMVPEHLLKRISTKEEELHGQK